jgi:serine protease AprX
MPGEMKESAPANGEMPGAEMSDMAPNDMGMPDEGMPSGEMNPGGAPSGETVKVLVELRVPSASGMAAAYETARAISVPNWTLDESYEPVPVSPMDHHAESLAADEEEPVILRGEVPAAALEQTIQELESDERVLKVWLDTPIAPFAVAAPPDQAEEVENVDIGLGLGTCAIPPCDCQPGTAKGTIADVASYLGCDQIWATAIRGQNMVVGVVDGGITAIGRTPKPGETAKVARVIGGFPADWGTTSVAWGDHGNMTSTDVLGMAPEAEIYDIRISGGDIQATISAALAGFQWAINQHHATGKPQVLTNSWGIFQEGWDTSYAHDPNHPFTRKVVDALNEGILVLFAAGNCGEACPDNRCGTTSIGPGHSIWGANGHPRVMTVAATNKNEEYIGYSSQGPAALDPHKPDFCSISHFKGYFASDTGTSAACPIAAGIVALLKQANPALTQDQVKAALQSTAKDIGPAGWDQHSGAGIIRAKRAFDAVARPRQWSGFESLGGTCEHGVAAASWAANRLDCFVVGIDSAMWHKWWDGAGWRGWESLGGICEAAPAAVSWGPSRIDTFVLGTDSAMWHKWWDGAAWRGWESLGGTCEHGVAAASWAANRLDCFVVGTDSAMWHKWWDGAGWRGWESLGGVCTSAPAAVSWGPNRIDCFVIGTDSAMWHKWWDGAAWRGWESLGGTCQHGVAVSSWGSNRLDCFVIGTDNAIWHKWWDGAGWRGWERLGGVCTSAPAAVSWGSNRIDTFVLGTDHAMWHKVTSPSVV